MIVETRMKLAIEMMVMMKLSMVAMMRVAMIMVAMNEEKVGIFWN